MRVKSALVVMGIGLLSACVEGTGGVGGAPASPTGGAPGDEVFTRDEKGCLYQKIEGTLVPIVDASGRKMCDLLS
jgi:hypothetical protein